MTKKLLSFRTKYSIRLRIQKFRVATNFHEGSLDKTKRKAFIFLAADYGNLGDVAITYAQKEFLEKNLGKDFQVIEIPISKSLEGLWFAKKNIRKGDIVTTVGGGNMGDLYDQIEYIRQLVIRFFPDNKIISFPQTFDFAENTAGRKALAIAAKTYSRHKNLVLVAREKISFDLMKKYFPKNKVILTPDIVLSLHRTAANQNRNGVVFCLRNDAEKSLSIEQNDQIIKLARNKFGTHAYYDTHIGKHNLSVQERKMELSKIWDKFRSSELVITDRLHGMIFCYITNTPCIVFQNNNHKVRETFKWLPAASNIKLLETFSLQQLETAIEDLKVVHPYIGLNNHYGPLLKELN